MSHLVTSMTHLDAPQKALEMIIVIPEALLLMTTIQVAPLIATGMLVVIPKAPRTCSMPPSVPVACPKMTLGPGAP